jgi:hypothetical protein
MKKVNLAEQLNAFASGRIIDSDGDQNDCFNFYDWFCKDSSLERKAKALFPKVIKFVAAHPEIAPSRTYVFFKNNCPMNGPLYDDFRICDVESGNVIYTVIPKCGHSGKAEIWGRKESDGEFGMLKQADTFSKLFVQIDEDPNFTDSAGFSIADREDEEEGSHHCDDPSCNCSI